MTTRSQRHLFFAGTLLCAITSAVWADSVWPSFDRLFDTMEGMFERHIDFAQKMFSQTREAFSSQLPSKSGITAEINEDKEKLAVIVNGIEGEEIDAHLNELNDELTITTRDSKITLNSYHPARMVTSLAINVRQERQESIEADTDKAEKKEEREKYPRYNNHTISLSSIATTVAGRLNLEENQIDYDEDAGQLTISIPKPTQPTGKKVAVNVVKAAKKTEQKEDETEKAA